MIDPTTPSGMTAREIPQGIIVTCPLHQMAVQPAQTCFGCEHFAGIAVLNPSPDIPWEQRHIVLCRYRRKLPLQRVGSPASTARIGNLTVVAG